MTCRDVEARITAYLDGELDATSSSALRGHLRSCEACRVLAEDHARIAGALAELPPVDPSPAMWDGVMARLAESEKADAQRSRLALWASGAWDRLRPQLLPVTAGAMAVALGVAWIARHRGGPDEAPAPSPREAVSPVSPSPEGPIGLAPQPVAPPAPPPADVEDVEVSLARERERIDRAYATTAADLLAEAQQERAEWSPAQQRVFDAELARLSAAVEAAPLPRLAPAGPGGDHFERAEALAAAGERRERAWQRLITFLQHAALGERVAARGAGHGGPR